MTGFTQSAFLQPVQLQTVRVARIGHNSAVCRANPPHNDGPREGGEEKRETARVPFLPRVVRPTRLPSVVVATMGALLGATLTARPFRAPMFIQPANASQSQTSSSSSKTLRYDGRQELDSREKAMSLTLTAGTFAALGIWAWKKNRRDDELENVRIKDEVDRLEKLRAEFMDVEEDDDSLDDEDLLASLKQRLSEGDEEDDDSEDNDSEEAGTDSEANGATDKTEDASSESDKGNPNSLDMLRRMWEATDDDSKKKKT